MTLISRIKRRLCRANWPPFIACFGWYNGNVAVAWNSLEETEMYIAKYLAIFDLKKRVWKFKHLGFFNLEDGFWETWFDENLLHPNADNKIGSPLI